MSCVRVVSKVSGALAWAASTAWYPCTAVSSSAAESPDIVPPQSGSFTELNTGLDHLGLVATSREELEAWERRFEEHGVSYTPIRDTEMGHHLNFRDPDGIALEFDAPTDLAMKAQRVLASGQMTLEEIAAFVAERFGPEYVSGSDGSSQVI